MVIGVAVDDGCCNDETNNGVCNYDAGGCCGIVESFFFKDCWTP